MKRNTLKRTLATVCAAAMVMGCLAGCGKGAGNGEKVDNTAEDKTNLKVMLYAKGYGSEWLTKMAEAFEAKNPGVKVTITPVNSSDVMRSDVKNVDYCDTDLYFDIVATAGSSLVNEFKQTWEGKQGLRDLTYLVDSQIPGEEVTLGEKMNDSLLYASMYEGRDTEDTADDVYYTLPYVTGAMGLYYNETVIDNALGKGNWSVPRTTDELIALCKNLKAKGCSIMLPGALDQWASSMFLSWWAQYEGLENYHKFYEAIGYNTTKSREEQNSSFIYEQPGRLASLKVSSELLNNKTGYALENAAEIGANNLNEYQSRFTLAKNNYAFYPCGDWLMQELKNNSTIESDSVIKMMKMPVISSIIESTDSYSGSADKRLPNIKSDKVLAQVVDYVDGKGDLPAGVTEDEAAIVKEARNVMGSKGTDHIVYAPAFSNAKTLADDFLLFMASDEGIKIFKENCIGGFAPYDYEYSDLETTEQSVYEATKTAEYVDDFRYHKLFYIGGINAQTAGTSDTLDGLLCKPNGMSAEELHESFLTAYSGVKWESYLSKIQ